MPSGVKEDASTPVTDIQCATECEHSCISSQAPSAVEITPENATINNEAKDEERPPSPTEITCEVCNKTFSARRRFYVQLGEHAEDKPHVCKICHRAFHYLGELSSHFHISLIYFGLTCIRYHFHFRLLEITSTDTFN